MTHQANGWISLRSGKMGKGTDPPKEMLPAVLGVFERGTFTPIKRIVGMAVAEAVDRSWKPAWMDLQNGRVHSGVGKTTARGYWVPGRLDPKGGFHVDEAELRKWLAMPWDTKR
jgi:hypothetical protein